MRILSYGLDPKQTSYVHIIWLPFWISSLFSLLTNFVYTYFFVDIYIIMIVVYLEKYIHKKSYISTWYLNSSVSHLYYYYFLFFGDPGYNFTYEFLSYLYHILVHSSWWISFTSCLSWRANYLHHRIRHKLWFLLCIFFSLCIHLNFVLWRILGSDDSIFVQLVFTYRNYKLCTNIGELLYFL